AFGTLEEITRSVRQVRSMEVLLARADQVDLAARVIRAGIEPEMAVTESPAECAVRFQTRKREEELAGVLSALVSAPVAVAQFREVQADLEDAFLTVAKQAEDGAAAPSPPQPR